MFIKFKQLFTRKKYDEFMRMAKLNNVNLGISQLYLRSIVNTSFTIEYDDKDVAKAKELLSVLDKIEFYLPDEME